MEISSKEKSNLLKGLGMLVIIVSIFFVVKIISEIKGLRFIGGGAPASNTMVFNGKGEVFASPDIALVNITIRESAPDIKGAQTKATAKETAVLAFLDKSGIAKKDIKTESYNSYPKYTYTSCYSYTVPCREESKITGYEASENISIKVRDLSKAGEIVKGVGAAGISEITGPNFSIENEDQLKEQARKMAIDEAKEKAEVLAKDLGVRLVRIVNFSENGDYSIYNYAQKEMAVESDASSAPAPELPTGENKITSSVTITYEIR
jgi:uncharacterized protein YggE